MSKSTMLRVADVCAAYRLIGDCRDVGTDPAEWLQVAFAGLGRLVGAVACSGGEGTWLRPAERLSPKTSCLVGFDERAADLLAAYMRAHGVLSDPIFQRIQLIESVGVTRTRRELVSDRLWYSSPSFNDYRRLVAWDHQLTSVFQVSARGAMTCLCLHREARDRDFSGRESRLVAYFHAELSRLIGGALVSALEPSSERLPPRLRQTLNCLLEGDSEKQVAARLGLSPHTVHEYVTALYRRFNVHSRVALIRHVLTRRGQADHKGRSTD